VFVWLTLVSFWNCRVSGRQAILTIYEDGVEKEQIKLYSLQTKEEMHGLFQEKGFKKKTQEALFEDTRLRVLEDQLARQEQFQPMLSNVFVMYGVMGLVAFAFMLLIRLNVKRQRRALRIKTSLPVRV
jgi:hypothetical protein